MRLDEAIERINICFNRDGWPLEINYEKLRGRSSLSEETFKPGWVVVQVERHRSIAGGSYTLGLSMSAYQTYWQQFAVHTELDIVEELPEKPGEFSIDVCGLVDEAFNSRSIDLGIDKLGKEKYRIYESVSGAEKNISTLQEVKPFVLGIIKGWYDSFKETLINEETIPKEQIEILVSEYKNCLDDRIIEEAEQVWRDSMT